MSGVDTTNARNAADSVRKLYNPAAQWLSFGMLGPEQRRQRVVLHGAGLLDRLGWPADATSGAGCRWACPARVPRLLVRLLGRDVAHGQGDRLLHELEHRHRPHGPDPDGVDRAHAQRPGRREQGDHPDVRRPAEQLDDVDVQLLPPGRHRRDGRQGPEHRDLHGGLRARRPNDIACPDTSGAWKGKMASALLASMATTSVAEAGCPTTENTDNDHYFCVPKTRRRLRRPLERLQDGGHVARAGNQARRAAEGLVRPTPGGRRPKMSGMEGTDIRPLVLAVRR